MPASDMSKPGSSPRVRMKVTMVTVSAVYLRPSSLSFGISISRTAPMVGAKMIRVGRCSWNMACQLPGRGMPVSGEAVGQVSGNNAKIRTNRVTTPSAMNMTY